MGRKPENATNRVEMTSMEVGDYASGEAVLTTVPTHPRRFSLSSISIKYRLPLFIAVLLIGMVVAFTWAAYRSVRDSALQVGRERLNNLSQQLAILSQQQNATLLGKTFAAANDDAIRSFLQTPSWSSRHDALALLQQFNANQDQNSLQVELWNEAGTLALTSPEGLSAQPSDLGVEFKRCAIEPFKTSGGIRVLGDKIVYPMVSASKDESGKLIGYLVRWRKVASTPEAKKQLKDLLGGEATLYLGNTQGDLWTDLETVVPKPQVDLASTPDVSRLVKDGNSVMALARSINGTPWSLVLEFPDNAFLAQAGVFLRRIVIVGLVLIAIGLVAAFGLSRSITKPLHLLTKAASGISNGDYSYDVDTRRTDEMGILANAFKLMTAKIHNSQLELEQEVHARTDQLKAANKELEAFSYSVSHDLRAPLRHINGFSQMLLEDYEEQLDDVAKGFLRELHNSSKEMSQLIDDILQLARITRREMHAEVVDLSDLAHRVTEDLKKGYTGPTPVVNIGKELSTLGDKRLLRIMLTNLLGNALKFSSKRKTPEINFGRATKNGETCYFVSDNGAGFDMAYVDKLFGAFQRLHSVTEFEGTGIGLATVQRIIHRHGGNVWAEGSVGQGATFYFTLNGFAE